MKTGVWGSWLGVHADPLPLGQGLWEIYQTQKLRDHLQMGRAQMSVGVGTPVKEQCGRQELTQFAHQREQL